LRARRTRTGRDPSARRPFPSGRMARWHGPCAPCLRLDQLVPSEGIRQLPDRPAVPSRDSGARVNATARADACASSRFTVVQVDDGSTGRAPASSPTPAGARACASSAQLAAGGGGMGSDLRRARPPALIIVADAPPSSSNVAGSAAALPASSLPLSLVLVEEGERPESPPRFFAGAGTGLSSSSPMCFLTRAISRTTKSRGPSSLGLFRRARACLRLRRGLVPAWEQAAGRRRIPARPAPVTFRSAKHRPSAPEGAHYRCAPVCEPTCAPCARRARPSPGAPCLRVRPEGRLGFFCFFFARAPHPCPSPDASVQRNIPFGLANTSSPSGDLCPTSVEYSEARTSFLPLSSSSLENTQKSTPPPCLLQVIPSRRFATESNKAEQEKPARARIFPPLDIRNACSARFFRHAYPRGSLIRASACLSRSGTFSAPPCASRHQSRK
jgi:hypothetical protein